MTGSVCVIIILLIVCLIIPFILGVKETRREINQMIDENNPNDKEGLRAGYLAIIIVLGLIIIAFVLVRGC